MRLIIFCTLFTLVTADDATAQNRSFPYQARVATDELFVRSGGGDSWLPTQRLTKDAVVTVHRHDPGGWFMIEPPEGSFSWIPERFVKRLSDTEGEIIENNVVAFVGSEFGEDTTVWQRRLASGEKITILSQKELVTLSGPQVMYQIKPPRREFRWIPGAGVIPVDEQRKQQQDTDPYATPSNATRPGPGQQQAAGGVTDLPAVRPDSELARLQRARADQVRLAAIDKQFREMILRDPGQWNLDSIEADYKRLQSESTYKPLAGQIDLRYPAIERYRRKLAEFHNFKRLTSQTESREAALLAKVNPRYSPATRVAAAAPPAASAIVLSTPSAIVLPAPSATDSAVGFPEYSNASWPVVPQPVPTPTPDDISNQPAWGLQDSITPLPSPQSGFSSETPDQSGLTLEPASESGAWFSDQDQTAVPKVPADSSEIPVIGQTSSLEDWYNEQPKSTATVLQAVFETDAPETDQRQFVGAGILQRSPAGDSGSAFVLATTTGRILAHVKPETGVDLQPYLGQQVGLLGQRTFRPELQSDLIEVSGVESVRIRR